MHRPLAGTTLLVTDEMSGAAAGIASKDEVHVALGGDLQAPSRARAAVRRALLAWQLPALVEPVSLVASELVTNALLHGSPPVALTLRRGSSELRMGVHDNNPQPPPWDAASAYSGDATSGRGLGIVASVADAVGVEAVPDDGKIVYASFATAR